MNWLPKKEITIALLDDHPIIRRSIEVVMTSEPDLKLLGCFGHSMELVRFLRANTVDVLILDYILGDEELDGLSLIRQLLNHYPRLKILMSSSVESQAVVRTAYNIGIKGYISKRKTTEEFFDAVRQVANGQIFIPEEIRTEMSQMPLKPSKLDIFREQTTDENGIAGEPVAEVVFSNVQLLTPRESEVLRCFLDGMTILQISAKLKRSRKTVSGHKQSGMKKLGIQSDLELFKYREDLFN